MILNVSGRTDILAFYSKWFINRLEEGFVDVKNPFNPKLVSRIYFENVDAILFCTKNPLPIIPYINKINKPIVFHITITPYGKDIEPNVIDKRKIIDGIKEISKIIGSDNIFVRYDPIFLNRKYTLDYHIKAFKKLCALLNGYIKGFVVSFLDDYKNVQKNYHIIKPQIWNEDDYKKFGLSFSAIAKEYNLTVQTCAEKKNLVEYGFIKGECMSKEMAAKLTGNTNFKKWTARKKTNCECVEMVDIGAYNSCNHLCKYCYANFDEDKIAENIKLHHACSTMLIGEFTDDCKIVVRE